MNNDFSKLKTKVWVEADSDGVGFFNPTDFTGLDNHYALIIYIT